MFYSAEILTQREYGVATVWLVATLGSKSNVMKVQRKDILSVDVPKACDTICSPEAPLALRLQSKLLYGVTKCYSQQYHYFLKDVTHVYALLRKTYSTANPAVVSESLPVVKTRNEQFILADDPAFVLGVDFSGLEDILDLGVQLPILDNLSLLQNSQSSPSHTQSRDSGRSKPSIPAIHLSGSSSVYGGDLGWRSPSPEEAEKLLEDVDFEFGEDGTVRDIEPVKMKDLHSTPTTAPPQTAQSKHGRERLDSDPFLIGQVQRDHAGAFERNMSLGARDDIMLNAGVQLDDSKLYEASGISFGQTLLRQDELQSVLGNGDLEEEEIPRDAQDVIVNKRGQRNKITVDPSTEYKNMDLASWRDNYIQNMEQQIKKRNASKQNRIAKAYANKLVLQWGIGGKIRNPALNILFSGKALFQTFSGSQTGQGPTHGKKRPFGGSDEEGRRQRSRRDAGIIELSYDDTVLQEDNGIEMARKASVDPYDLAEESRNSIMPWDKFSALGLNSRPGSRAGLPAPSVVSSSGGNSFGGAFMSGSSFGSSRPSRGRRIDAGPFPGRGLRISVSPLAGRARLDVLEKVSSNSGLIDQEDEELYLGVEDQTVDDFEFFGAGAQVDTQKASTSQFLLAAMELESNNFLEFVKSGIEKQREETEDPSINSITFSQLIPPNKNTRIVAAQALHHTAFLATKELITVQQQESYGTIHIKLHDY